MATVPYEIVAFDGGWAFKLGDWISQRYPSREAAMINAEQSAQEARRNAESPDESKANG